MRDGGAWHPVFNKNNLKLLVWSKTVVLLAVQDQTKKAKLKRASEQTKPRRVLLLDI